MPSQYLHQLGQRHNSTLGTMARLVCKVPNGVSGYFQPPQELTAALQRGMYKAVLRLLWCMLCVLVKKAGNRGSQVPPICSMTTCCEGERSKVEKIPRARTSRQADMQT